MSCGINTGCNHDCRQGRDCPAPRTTGLLDVLLACVIGVSLAMALMSWCLQ